MTRAYDHRDGGRVTHIPLIGRLTLFEFLGFIALFFGIVMGLGGILAFLPLLDEILQPGSGGGAQMLLAMFVLPGLYFYGVMFFACIVGFYCLFRKARDRIRKRRAFNADNMHR